MFLKIPPLKNLLLLITLLGSALLNAGVTMDEDGWTVITPSADSRIVYVSSSSGDNQNDGLSPESAKRTINAGAGLIRDGYPDHLLLKRGDVFEPADGTNLGRWKNGRNVEEPIVVGYYGESGARPLLKVTGTFVNHDGDRKDYQAFMGLDIYKSNSDPASADFNNSSCISTLRFVGGGAHLRIEDCRIRFGMITVESFGGSTYTYPVIRRNIITDTWAHGSYVEHTDASRIQGLYLGSVRGGYTIEENVFDHNGWSEVVANAGANMFNHNVYIQYSNVEGGIIRGNIVARGAAHGIQARSGGIAENNLFVLNAISLNMGGHGMPTVAAVHDFPNRVTQNVILNGRLMDPGNSSYPRTGAVWGINATYFHSLFEDNIVANRVNSSSNQAFNTGEDGSFTLEDNIVYQWDSQYNTTNASWAHPDADMGDYFASTGGTNDTIAYFNWLRERPLREWPWEMTAYAAIDYIREGFRSSSASYLEGWPASQPVAYMGGVTSFRIESNLSWTVEESAGWLEVDKTSASGNDTLTVTVQPNTTTTKRTGVVTVKSGTHTRTLNVWQDGIIPYISTQPASIAVNGAEAVTTFTISSSTSWSVAAVSSWLSVAPVSGSGNGTITVTAQNNPGQNLRMGQIQVTGSGGLGERIVQVYQTKETWAGLTLANTAKDVNTGDAMFGWINVAARPWVWIYESGTYTYLADAWVGEEGTWAYVSGADTDSDLMWAASGDEHFYYSHALGKWAYCHTNPLENDAYWMWLKTE